MSRSDKSIYLDNHATTPVDERVIEGLLPYLRDDFANPTSRHHMGFQANRAVDQARKAVASLIGGAPDDIYFCSGATEANNLVIRGITARSTDPHIVVTTAEHKCIYETSKNLQKAGVEVTFVPVDSSGFVDPEDIKRSIKSETVLVSAMYANNEVGTINQITEIGKICKEAGVPFHTDAAQALGKVPIDVEHSNIDLLSASGHKFYAPKGTGFLYGRSEVMKQLEPQTTGGGQEKGFRSGTLNVPGIVGLGIAARIAQEEFPQEVEHLFNLRSRFYAGMTDNVTDILLNGPQIEERLRMDPYNLFRLPNNLNLSIKDVPAKELIRRSSRLAFSTGSACMSESQTPSHVLVALGHDEDRIKSSVRFGFGKMNTKEEVDEAIGIISEAVRKIRR